VTTLYSRARDQVSLAEALRQAGIPAGVALLSSPTRHVVAELRDGVGRTPGGGADLTGVFEARAFDGRRELRWLHVAAGRGRAVVLGEDDADLPGGFERLAPIEAVELIEQRYLLWGEAVGGAPPGWTTLSTARIGSLTVPVSASPGQRVRLRAREYVVAEPQHGNAYVAEERLLGLEAHATPRPKGGTTS
jgi:CRISPR-associated protein (TIGR03984 family)